MIETIRPDVGRHLTVIPPVPTSPDHLIYEPQPILYPSSEPYPLADITAATPAVRKFILDNRLQVSADFPLEHAILAQSPNPDYQNQNVDRLILSPKPVSTTLSGNVYQAYDARTRRIVAAKTINHGTFSAQEIRDKIIRQATFQSNSGEYFAVPVYDVIPLEYCDPWGKPISTTAMLMAWQDPTERPTLENHLNTNGSLSIPDTIMLGTEMAYIIEHLAKSPNGLLSLDLKPSNFFVQLLNGQLTNHLRITDFGVAQLLREIAQQQTYKTINGTPMYLSPDRITGQKPTRQSEVYSHALIVWEMLIGKPMFGNMTTEQIIDYLGYQAHGVPHKLIFQLSSYPPQVLEAFNVALDRLPMMRFSSPVHFMDALAHAFKIKLPPPLRTLQSFQLASL